ncbi:MAG: hypothetical protein ETSY1_05205, partial [Candidatus Entotheonella factor]
MADERHIRIEGDAAGNIIITGNANRIEVMPGMRTQEPEAPAIVSAIGPNPYVGLAAFTERESERFFGREQQTALLWQIFRGLYTDVPEASPGQTTPVRVLPILGPSGSGKSSLARAGLLPELAKRPLPGWQTSRVVVVRPDAHPLEALAVMLARLATREAAPVAKTREFEEELKRRNQAGDYDGLRRIVDALPGIDTSPLIVLVDQFEEIYTLCQDTTERDQFVANLLHAAADRSQHLSVVLTLRSDFLGQTQQHPDLNRLIAAQGVIVPAMSSAELRDAITKPAIYANPPLDAATVDLLVAETDGREGALPLLQFALERIWEGMAHGIPPAETLRGIGGVGGALASEAQRLYDRLTPEQQLVARRAFLAMIQLGEGTQDTRRRVEIADLVAHAEEAEHVRHVLRTFAGRDARLVTLATEMDGTDWAEVTHEALFEHWADLREWLDRGRTDLRFHRRLTEAARNWQEQGRPDGSLWRSPDLDLLQAFHRRAGDDMTAGEVEFMSLSATKARRAWRLRWLAVIGLIVLTLAAGGMAYVAQLSSRQARVAEIRAERRFNDVRELANSFIFEFHNAIKNLAGATPARELLVRRALTYLQRLSQEAEDDLSLQRDLAASYLGIGDIQVSTGNVDEAAKSYQQGLKIFERISQANPTNVQAQRDLSVSYDKIGNIQAATGETQGALERG